MPASANGTPTTNYGFATLDTSVDAPNGTGINNIIIDIDTKLKTSQDSQDASIAAKASIALIIALGA